MTRMPYLAQLQPGTCGAAALAMVLGKYDQPASVENIASELISKGPDGQPRIRTVQLAGYARKRGLLATIARLEQPWKAIYEAQRADVSVIINHRIDFEKPTGHFSVVTNFDPKAGEIRLNDPQRGPDTKWSLAEMSELWSPSISNSQISGNIAIFCMPRPAGGVAGACMKCNSPELNPDYFQCEKCRNVLEPLEHYILGCLMPECPDRLWQEIFCPECDRPWSKSRAIARLLNKPLRPNVIIEPEKPSAEVNKISEPENNPVQAEIDSNPEEVIPGESLKALAEAVKSIPLPDFSAMAFLASAQKSVLSELALITGDSTTFHNLSDGWQHFNDEIKASNQLLEQGRNEISADLNSEAEKLSTAAKSKIPLPNADLSALQEIATESDADAAESGQLAQADKNSEQPRLPDANELVRRLMSRLNH